MFDLMCRKLILRAKQQTIKSALFPASSSYRTSDCLLTFNISLGWVMLTLALALKVSLSGRDMPVCFGLYSTTLSIDSISSRHAVSGMHKHKPGCVSVHAVSTFPLTSLMSVQKSRLENKTSPPDWSITAVRFNPPRLLSNWCGSPQVPVRSYFGDIVCVKLWSCCRVVLRDHVSVKRWGRHCDVLLFTFSVDECQRVVFIYSNKTTDSAS